VRKDVWEDRFPRTAPAEGEGVKNNRKKNWGGVGRGLPEQGWSKGGSPNMGGRCGLVRDRMKNLRSNKGEGVEEHFPNGVIS